MRVARHVVWFQPDTAQPLGDLFTHNFAAQCRIELQAFANDLADELISPETADRLYAYKPPQAAE